MKFRIKSFYRYLLILGAYCFVSLAYSQLSQVFDLERDKKYELTIHVGQTISIKLPSNPSTGFRWELKPQASQKCLTFKEEIFEPSTNSENKIGVGGSQVWSIKADCQSEGESIVRFEYVRSWELKQEPNSLTEIKIKITQ